MTARDRLIEMYLGYLNNYLSVALWAEHNGLVEHEAHALLGLARSVYHQPHPEQ